jgi:hypothetical protein
MLLDVTGVLFDGSPLRPGVPSNARVPIRMQRGTSVTIRLKVINAAGQQVDLTQSGRSIVFAVKKKPTDNPPAIAKTVTGPAASGDPKTKGAVHARREGEEERGEARYRDRIC